MKMSEIRPCDCCGGEIAPFFYVIRSSMAIFDKAAVNEQLGMTQMFGGSGGAMAIAEIMGARPEVVKIAGDENKQLWNEAFICQDCMMKPQIWPLIFESVNEKKEVKVRA